MNLFDHHSGGASKKYVFISPTLWHALRYFDCDVGSNADTDTLCERSWFIGQLLYRFEMASTESLDGSAFEGDISSIPQVGHLTTEPQELECPACQQLQTTHVKSEAVTVLQKIACSLNVLLCWCVKF